MFVTNSDCDNILYAHQVFIYLYTCMIRFALTLENASLCDLIFESLLRKSADFVFQT